MSHPFSRRSMLQSMFGGVGCLGLASILSGERAQAATAGVLPFQTNQRPIGPRNVRRTVYGRVSRGRQNSLLKNYDFPDAMQSAGGRDLTITPLQQLFVMNSAFMHEAAAQLAESIAGEPDDVARLRLLFRKTLGREATTQELELALGFLNGGTIEQYAQVLLSTNEEIFWP